MNEKVSKLVKNDKNEFKSIIASEIPANSAIFKIISDFFKIISEDEKASKEYGVSIVNFILNNRIIKPFDMSTYSDSQNGSGVIFDLDGERFSIRLKNYLNRGEMFYDVSVDSLEEVNLSGSYVYNAILYSALMVSKLKGSYFKMSSNQFSWEFKDLEKRDFNDIYLPDELMSDLKLYVDIFAKKGKILRYLKVGNPGTSKTESTLVISNELNKLGVTVIKTNVDDFFHQKVELANILAPSVLILDDIDLSLGGRQSGRSDLLGDFLDVLDGTEKLSDNVGIIATTNASNLLDLAAQRPGRFDKTLLFDELTKSNIKKLITKSLRMNFDAYTEEDLKLFTDTKVVDKFFNAKVTGAHIYNTVKMLKLRYDTLDTLNDITPSTVVKTIHYDIKLMDKIKNKSFLDNKMSGGVEGNESSLGFKMSKNGVRPIKKDR